MKAQEKRHAALERYRFRAQASALSQQLGNALSDRFLRPSSTSAQLSLGEELTSCNKTRREKMIGINPRTYSDVRVTGRKPAPARAQHYSDESSASYNVDESSQESWYNLPLDSSRDRSNVRESTLPRGPGFPLCYTAR
ncbi:hypothetical protein CIB48_g7065 [Xylaria polymorpha]|nr:hypothetical protein CIB48_g7065 [Xylaria polymorpha]